MKGHRPSAYWTSSWDRRRYGHALYQTSRPELGSFVIRFLHVPHRSWTLNPPEDVLAMFEGMLGTGKIDYQEAERWEEGKQLGGSHFLSCQWIWKKRRLGIPDGPRDDLRSGLDFPPRPWRHSPGFHETMAKQKPPFISS